MVWGQNDEGWGAKRLGGQQLGGNDQEGNLLGAKRLVTKQSL